jgi:hypothetical protein
MNLQAERVFNSRGTDVFNVLPQITDNDKLYVSQGEAFLGAAEETASS